MKKKVLVILATLVACIAFVFAFAGCSENGSSENGGSGTEKINYAETVLVPYDGGAKVGMVYTYEYENNGYKSVCNSKSYTIADLVGNNMPFNNYSAFIFSWKTSSYKITKVEFDVTAQDTLNTVFYLHNQTKNNENDTWTQSVNISAGTTKHIAIECNMIKDVNALMISNNTTTEEYFNGSYCTAKWKLSNLFITAEKI